MCDVILFGNGSIYPVVSRCGKSYTGGFARTNRQQNQYLLTFVAVRKVADRKSVFFACIRKKEWSEIDQILTRSNGVYVTTVW